MYCILNAKPKVEMTLFLVNFLKKIEKKKKKTL